MEAYKVDMNTNNDRWFQPYLTSVVLFNIVGKIPPITSDWSRLPRGDKYLLLTEFEVRTVSYDLCRAQERSARAINRRGKTRFLTCGTDREDEFSMIFVISLFCVWRVRERFYSRGTASNFWSRSKAKRVDLKSFLSRLHALVQNLE